MFRSLPSVISNSDPFTASFEARLAALSVGQLKLAYFYHLPDNSTFRYRVLNMIECLTALPELGISAAWFSLADLPHFERFVDRADALVLCRTQYADDVSRMISRAKARGVRVLFDVDDLVFDTDYTHLILDTLDQNTTGDHVWNFWFAYIGRIGAALRQCDGVITTNEFLADRVKDFAPKLKTYVIPNFFNRRQQEESESLWMQKRTAHFARNEYLHIGYFSGTPTHNRDFAIAADSLAKILAEDSRVVLRVVGFLDPRGPLLPFKDQIEILPLQDFVQLQRLIAEVEINIAPLQNNAFTNCKSELKYFEAAIVGTATIASPNFTFARSIQHGSTGMLANSYEWLTALRTAIRLVDNRDEYAAMAERSFDIVQERYGWNRFVHRINEVIFGSNPLVEEYGSNQSLSVSARQT